MRRREYLKYHQELRDRYNVELHPGDTVIINNYYGNYPIVGEISHYTSTGRLVIESKYIHPISGNTFTYLHYRYPRTVIKWV
jgi:hypothetical protein